MKRVLRMAAIAGAVAVAAVVGIAYFQMDPVQSDESTGDFLSDVRNLRESGAGSASQDGLLVAGEDPNARPSIETATTEFDMGVISHKEPTEKQLMVKNTGKSPLIISDIRTTCGCTTGRFENATRGRDGKPVTTIDPGSEQPLIIRVDPFRIPTFHSKKTLTLQTNDPNHIAYQIEVSANVDPEFEIPEDHLAFGEVEQGAAKAMSIIIRQTGDDLYELQSIERGTRALGGSLVPSAVKDSNDEQSPLYTVSLEERPKDQWANPAYKEWEVSATLSPDLPPGNFTDHVWIDTTAPRYTRLRLTLSAFAKSFYQVTPQIVTVRQGVTAGDENVGEIVVTSDSPIELSDLTISGEDIVLRTEPGDGPNSARVLVSVAQNASPGLKNEVVTFNIKSGDRSAKHTMRVFIAVKAAS